MNELITQIVKNLVDKEDKVFINEVNGNSTHIFEITVDKADIGKVIGKQGNTAKAIRTLLKSISKKHDKKYILNII